MEWEQKGKRFEGEESQEFLRDRLLRSGDTKDAIKTIGINQDEDSNFKSFAKKFREHFEGNAQRKLASCNASELEEAFDKKFKQSRQAEYDDYG